MRGEGGGGGGGGNEAHLSAAERRKRKRLRTTRHAASRPSPYARELYAYKREEEEEVEAGTSDLSGMRAPRRRGLRCFFFFFFPPCARARRSSLCAKGAVWLGERVGVRLSGRAGREKMLRLLFLIKRRRRLPARNMKTEGEKNKKE